MSKEIKLEMDFSDKRRPKDWSVIAYGELGPVSISHSQGLKSDSLPVAPTLKEY